MSMADGGTLLPAEVDDVPNESAMDHEGGGGDPHQEQEVNHEDEGEGSNKRKAEPGDHGDAPDAKQQKAGEDNGGEEQHEPADHHDHHDSSAAALTSPMAPPLPAATIDTPPPPAVMVVPPPSSQYAAQFSYTPTRLGEEESMMAAAAGQNGEAITTGGDLADHKDEALTDHQHDQHDQQDDEEQHEMQDDEDDDDDEQQQQMSAMEDAVMAASGQTMTEAGKKQRRAGAKRSAVRPWNDMLYDLLRYRLNHNHTMVPFKTGGDLGKWVSNQRAQYANLLKTMSNKAPLGAAGSFLNDPRGGLANGGSGYSGESLTEERMRVLTSIGFVWDVVQADNDARWKKRFDELKTWRLENGHCNVPQSTELGKWVKMQRENKHEADLKKNGATPLRKKPKPCLSDDRVALLEGIGFQWRVAKPAVGWEKRYQQLIDYKNLHQDCNVPQSYPPDKPFGRWVMKQRCQHSLKLRGEKSQLTDEREEKLNAIGFLWVAPGFSKKTVTMPGGEEDEVMVHHGVDLEHAVHQVAVARNGHDEQEMAYHHQEHQQQQQQAHPGMQLVQQQQHHHPEFSWTGV